MSKVYIKCKSCGKIGCIDTDCNGVWKKYKCKSCGNIIEITFCGYCQDCKRNVGFQYASFSIMMVETAKAAIKGWINPIEGLKSTVNQIFNDVPKAEAYGYCPFCGGHYLRCPHCGKAVKTGKGIDSQEIIICDDCGHKMRHR